MMSQTQIVLWIVALFVVELYHVKWIWWTQWECSTCNQKHERCRCDRRKWLMYL